MQIYKRFSLLFPLEGKLVVLLKLLPLRCDKVDQSWGPVLGTSLGDRSWGWERSGSWFISGLILSSWAL